MTRKILASLALFILIISGVAFAIHRTTSATPEANTLQVVATYYPLYDFARHIGGEKVHITNITPAGAEPHDYEPSPKALVNAQKAAVFIYNGGTLEPWTEGFLHDYKHTAVKASTGIAMLMAENAAHADGHGVTHEHSSEHAQDPHFWLDPILAKQIVTNIRDGFIKADPDNKAYYAANATQYIAQLTALDTEYRTGLASCAQDTIISSHDAFSYLGKRYSVTIAAIAGMSAEEEPSAARLAEISRLVAAKGINYIFFESLVSPRLADTIAAETGAKTLVFDPIEGLTDENQKQGKDYLSVQRENLANLRIALACR